MCAIGKGVSRSGARRPMRQRALAGALRVVFRRALRGSTVIQYTVAASISSAASGRARANETACSVLELVPSPLRSAAHWLLMPDINLFAAEARFVARQFCFPPTHTVPHYFSEAGIVARRSKAGSLWKACACGRVAAVLAVCAVRVSAVAQQSGCLNGVCISSRLCCCVRSFLRKLAALTDYTTVRSKKCT